MPDSPSQAAYRAFCATAPDLPIFAQAWYLDACAEGGHWDAVLASEGGLPVAALPYFYKQRGPIRNATMPLFVKWLGPYVLPPWRGKLRTEHKLFAALIAQLPPLAAFRQAFYPTITNWLPFYWQKFQQTTHYTYRLPNLPNLPAIEAGLTPSVRRDLKQARQKLRVVYDLGPEVFYEVNAKSFARQGLTVPYSAAQFRRHEAVLAQHNARQLFFAVDAAGQVHSVALLIWDSTTAYYHLAGDDPALRQSNAGKLVLWEAICYASEVLQLACFDFEGSMLPAVEFVRVSFGAVQVPYLFVWKYQSRWLEWWQQLRA